MPFELVRHDITKMAVDAIVNAANATLQMGGGVCGAVFTAAGAEEMRKACDTLAPINVGAAVITPGFALLAKHVIHVASPAWRGGGHGEEAILRACYANALMLALEHNCESIAFPLLSSGTYGYPKAEALAVAISEIRAFLQTHDMQVYLVLFDKAAFTLSEQLLGGVKSYINAYYFDVQEKLQARSRRLLDAEQQSLKEAPMPMPTPPSALTAPTRKTKIMPPPAEAVFYEMPAPAMVADTFTPQLDEPFTTTLLRLIDGTGKADVEIYKRANIDRRLFSKIRSSESYMPSKRTALALAVALELPLSETNDLLRRAGYALSHSVMFDVIVEYFIANHKYDIFEINEVLFHYDQALLGG